MRGTSGDLRHPRQSRYRCSLPGLAGFAGPRCTEPEVPRSGSRALRAAAGSEFNTQNFKLRHSATSFAVENFFFNAARLFVSSPVIPDAALDSHETAAKIRRGRTQEKE